MSVDWNKPIQTRSGKKARFIGTREHPTYPRVVAITHYTDSYCTNAYEHIDTYTEDGIAYKEQMQHPNDIINTPSVPKSCPNCSVLNAEIERLQKENNTLRKAMWNIISGKQLPLTISIPVPQDESSSSRGVK